MGYAHPSGTRHGGWGDFLGRAREKNRDQVIWPLWDTGNLTAFGVFTWMIKRNLPSVANFSCTGCPSGQAWDRGFTLSVFCALGAPKALSPSPRAGSHLCTDFPTPGHLSILTGARHSCCSFTTWHVVLPGGPSSPHPPVHGRCLPWARLLSVYPEVPPTSGFPCPSPTREGRAALIVLGLPTPRPELGCGGTG